MQGGVFGSVSHAQAVIQTLQKMVGA